MAEQVDVRLEVALEAVLAKHGIPLFVGNGDRGDLASDLAEVVRRQAGSPIEAAKAHALEAKCCADQAWRGHLCPFHQGYEDGYDAALRALGGEDDDL